MGQATDVSSDSKKCTIVPYCRQWYYFFYLKKDIPSRNHKNLGKTNLYADYVGAECDGETSSPREMAPRIFRAYFCRRFCKNMHLTISFVAPTACNIVLWLYFRHDLYRLQLYNYGYIEWSQGHPPENFTFIEGCKELESNGNSTEASSENVSCKSSKLIIESISLSKNKDDRSIEDVLQSVMSLPSPWQDVPYIFTSTILQIVDDMSFNMIGINDTIISCLYQELEPIIIAILDENIQRRIYSRISTNINYTFSRMNNWMVFGNHRRVRKLFQDFFTIPFDGCSFTSSSSNVTLSSVNYPQRNDIMEWTVKGNCCNTPSTCSNDCSFESPSHCENRKCSVKSQRAESKHTSASISFSSHFNPLQLDIACSTTTSVRQTKSCLGIVCRETDTPLCKKTLTKVKSSISKRIDKGAMTLADEKRSKFENSPKHQINFNHLNEKGCDSIQNIE